ncbi:prepilin-type N-terminal cleavage/methylation domain-containing protein [Vibrio sp. Vb2880]|uniref:Pilus assembly protein PilA n=1 Tax=Vibrio furnissii TaxID=29494 RepID=A0A0Q2MZ09_VIBFU|nr:MULTISPECIES: prepilin-type N-terminal cleavage/methylation domain-containing protein [Vibrio]KQH84935.1 pilus assembly protein PilA [Vibrio furnissii]MBO0215116.1 prepilin-type N-terminal cleavage/methylation domain-containing protein [Vibrio sp. Vb2880]MCG6218020.1 prepilin-type N-terminal cleavage/methylation domain-containing protein [Vibrio furnissii]MCG6231058.1 prepilin-type N-terminal cleavage/methylation domain-containing protein [Vibrio furnissii]MCG6235064.1 prepilin-type N-termi
MNANQRKKQQGFTLIELMIVVAIIGVLSAIAVPAYKNYVTKSEIASGFATIKSTITPAELIVQSEGTLKAVSGATILDAIGITSGANPIGELTAVEGNTTHKGQMAFEFKNGGAAPATFTYTREDNGWKCAFDPKTTGLATTDAPKGCQ